MARPIALQMYTVRELCPKAFRGGIKKVADIGYKGIELAGLHGADPKEVAKWLKDLGLAATSTHGPRVKKDNVNKVVEQALILGYKRIISGCGPNDLKTEDAVRRAADSFNEAAEMLRPHGLSMGYHNHWWELDKIGDRPVHELFFNHASPEVFWQLDIYWAAFGRAFPPKLMAHYGKRMPLLHVKDGTLDLDEPHTAVGFGVLNMHNIIRAAYLDAVEWLIVEIDRYPGDPMEGVRKSYEYLTSEGLADGKA